jgi:hypothetical protein
VTNFSPWKRGVCLLIGQRRQNRRLAVRFRLRNLPIGCLIRSQASLLREAQHMLFLEDCQIWFVSSEVYHPSCGSEHHQQRLTETKELESFADRGRCYQEQNSGGLLAWAYGPSNHIDQGPLLQQWMMIVILEPRRKRALCSRQPRIRKALVSTFHRFWTLQPCSMNRVQRLVAIFEARVDTKRSL